MMTKTKTLTTTHEEIQHKQLSYTLGTKYSEQSHNNNTHLTLKIASFVFIIVYSTAVVYVTKLLCICAVTSQCTSNIVDLSFLRKLLKLTNTKIVHNDLLCSCRQTQTTSWRLSVDYLWLHEHSLLLHLCQLSHLSIF